MDDFSLIQSTGKEHIDRLLHGIVGIYNQAFPERIRAFYVVGSYADGSSIALSDIDLYIIFAGLMDAQESEQAQALERFCGQLSPIRLDLNPTSEAALSVADRILLKQGSMLIYGADIRDDILLPPLDAYQKYATWYPYRFLGQIMRDCVVLPYPLTYPDQGGEFYGYDRKRIPEWYPPEIEKGIKELVTGALRTATAILALRAGQYVGTKRDSVRLYRECIHDEWTNYLETLYLKGKLEWQYLIPSEQDDKLLLRELCQRTLAFENHYFDLYRTYLLGLLQQDEEDKIFALERLTHVVYIDEEMVRIVQELNKSGIEEIRQAAHHAQECILMVDNEV